MTITLTNLRKAIYSYLDDDGTRWTAGAAANVLDMGTDVDRAIKYGMAQAMRYYTENGGDSILVQKEFTTDQSGQVELNNADDTALYISNVAVKDANTWTIARATRADEVEYTDISPRTIRVNFVPEANISIGGSVDFVSDSNIEVPELEILTTIYSVKNLLPRDAEQNVALDGAAFQAENSIKNVIDTPFAVDFPRYGRSQTTFLRYRWTFIKFDATSGKKNVIQLHRPLYSFYNVAL